MIALSITAALCGMVALVVGIGSSAQYFSVGTYTPRTLVPNPQAGRIAAEHSDGFARGDY